MDLLLLFAVFCALLIGWIGGGRLRAERIGLRALWLPIAALLCQCILRFLPAWRGIWLLTPLSYLAIFIFLLCNLRMRKSVALLGLGSLCNFIVIAANNWRMPVARAAASILTTPSAQALRNLEIPGYLLENDQTRLIFLGDICYIPIPVLGGFASIGDFLLMIGIFFLILHLMQPKKFPHWMITG